MLNAIASWLIRHAQRTPYLHISRYMNRWWLIPYNRFGIAARIHQILRSDEDRHLHDHPWWYISVVLRGGYWEITLPRGDAEPNRMRLLHGVWRGPGSIAFRRASHFHKIKLPGRDDTGSSIGIGVDVSCWTLFITGPKSQDWGFLVGQEKIPARDYLGDRFVETDYSGER